jgi:hypothetical protein
MVPKISQPFVAMVLVGNRRLGDAHKRALLALCEKWLAEQRTRRAEVQADAAFWRESISME